MKKLLAVLLMFTLVFGLAACGSEDEIKVTVTAASETTIEVGETVQLSAKVEPEDADQSVTWVSALDSVASVDANGLVTGVARGNTIIRAISVADDTKSAAISITVASGAEETRPDLGGYTIKIAQAGHALNEIDPFHPDYLGQDGVAKQQAWQWVQDAYNVNIEVVPYPEDAPWGSARWNYILQQAASNVSDYDFLTVPDAQIATFVSGDALIDVTDWYAKYGEGSMDNVYKQSGTVDRKLYSITGGTSGIYSVLYYNTNLLERLELEKTPAQMFNDGDWTFTEFKNYVAEAYAALSGLDDDKDYVALDGNATFLWVGMANAGGVVLADPINQSLNLKDPIAVEAAEVIREIYETGAYAPAMLVDAEMANWMEGTSLFALGDLWFVNTSNRWPVNLWGPGDATRYDYVPFPRPDGTDKEDQQIGLGGTATFVMPIGVDYTEGTSSTEVNAENVYRALMDTFIKTEEFLVNAPGYTQEGHLRNIAADKADSEDSIQAFMYIARKIYNGEIGFYEPFSTSDNPVHNVGVRSTGTLAGNINDYVRGNIATFAEAVDPLIPNLEQALRVAFS